ncbi:MAG: hypothetical protein ACJ8ER_14720 [Allosphingosinicella sp.]
MLRYVMAALLAAAPVAAAQAQIGQAQSGEPGGWALAPMQGGCMVQAVSPQGTMLSIWGLAGDEKLGFLLQNRGWHFKDGEKTPLSVEFAGTRAWPVEAVARAEIDSDGPGLYFTVEPGGESGFLTAFTSADGMSISKDGRSVDTLPLAGSRTAIAGLARCLSERWNQAAPAPEAEDAHPAPDSI